MKNSICYNRFIFSMNVLMLCFVINLIFFGYRLTNFLNIGLILQIIIGCLLAIWTFSSKKGGKE